MKKELVIDEKFSNNILALTKRFVNPNENDIQFGMRWNTQFGLHYYVIINNVIAIDISTERNYQFTDWLLQDYRYLGFEDDVELAVFEKLVKAMVETW